MRSIRYAIDLDTGMVVSRVDRHWAWPILDFAGIGRDGDFTAPLEYNLEIVEDRDMYHTPLKRTRKIPIEIKNLHRKFWGMKALAS
ncbi:MAG: hypothetical protein ACYTEQ_31180 [Planctomycetota bacterium]|jgi:hypothetical protein